MDMTLGPIEVIVAGFPGNRFNGKIMPALQSLVDRDIVSVVDGLLIMKDDEGVITFVELEEIDANDDAAALAGLLDQTDGLLSDEDVEELAMALEPNSSAAALVLEHTWAKPLRDAIVDSDGVLIANFRVPGLVVQEVLDALAEEA
jgi:dsDNA-binding SOS-regulon protein